MCVVSDLYWLKPGYCKQIFLLVDQGIRGVSVGPFRHQPSPALATSKKHNSSRFGRLWRDEQRTTLRKEPGGRGWREADCLLSELRTPVKN